MASAKQRANRTAFGVNHGKNKARADKQLEREAKRLTAYHQSKK